MTFCVLFQNKQKFEPIHHVYTLVVCINMFLYIYVTKLIGTVLTVRNILT